MMSMELEVLAALDAAGALGEEEQRSYRTLLASASAGERAAVAQLYELAAHLALSAEPVAPPAGARGRLMQRVEASNAYTLLAADGEWAPGPVPGTTLKLLSVDRVRQSATMLMRVSPGARYPAHHHTGGEDCYVIAGEIVVQGQRLRAGDFHRAEPGSDHGELWSDTGAEVLLVVNPADYR
jgi:anti-sigma factor ChrR (cupin superfamily)